MNTVIDHIEKKCLIIINNWSDETTNEIKFIEGDLPSKRVWIEKGLQTGPLNKYIFTIFEELGYFKSNLMLNSTFKNIIRDVDNIHVFYNKETQGKKDKKSPKKGDAKNLKNNKDTKSTRLLSAGGASTRTHSHVHGKAADKDKEILSVQIQDEFIHEGLSSMHKLDGIFVQISKEQYDMLTSKEGESAGGFNK